MAEYMNFVIMGAVGLFAIVFGIWFNWKLGAKKRAAKRAAERQRAAAVAARQKAAAADGDEFEEEYMTEQDNALPDDDDGEFKDSNLFGMKRRKDGPNVFRDWD